VNHPFRFYGRHPDDWASGANDGHGFTIAFQSPPDDHQRRQIAERFEHSLAHGPARPSLEPWMWSDRFSLFRAGERGRSGGAFLGAVTGFLHQAHAIAPIDDVVFLGAREGGGHWDAASVAAGRPAPRPAFGVIALHPAHRFDVDDALPSPAPDEAFESARSRVRDALEARRIDAALRDRKPGTVGVAAAPEPGWRGMSLEWTDDDRGRFDVPDPLQVEGSNGRSTRAPGDHPIRSLGPQSPHVCWVVGDGGWAQGLAWLRDGVRTAIDLKPLGFGNGQVAVSTEGPEGTDIVAHDRRMAVRVALSTKKTTVLVKGGVLDIAALGPNHVAVLTADDLQVIDRGAQTTHRLKNTGNKHLLGASRDGRFLAAAAYAGKPVFYGHWSGTLRKLGASKAPLTPERSSRDGQLYLRSTSELYVLDDPDGAWDAWAGPKAERQLEQAARTAKKRAPKPEVVAVPLGEVPSSPALDPAIVEAMPEHARICSGAGRAAATVPLNPQEHQASWRYGGLLWLDGDQLVDFTDELRAAGGPVGSGHRLEVGVHGRMLWLYDTRAVFRVDTQRRSVASTPSLYGQVGNPTTVLPLDADSAVVAGSKGAAVVRFTGLDATCTEPLKIKEVQRGASHRLDDDTVLIGLSTTLSKSLAVLGAFRVPGHGWQLGKVKEFKEPNSGWRVVFHERQGELVLSVVGYQQAWEARHLVGAVPAARKRLVKKLG
jgi:hypothetical protein